MRENGRPLADSLVSEKDLIDDAIDKAMAKVAKSLRSDPSEGKSEDKSNEGKKTLHDLGKQVFEASVVWADLERWRDANGMPIKSFLDVYDAIGLMPAMRQWKEGSGLPVIPQMQIGCTMSTLNQLKAFIVENWEWWPMELAGNDHVVWKDGWEHKKRNSAHSIKARVRNSLAYDAEQYGPFIADHKTLLTDADKFWFYDRELTVQERKERDQIDADAKKAQ